jgi:alkylation response protein AidB-like acyl-CoA dehydrogenase
MDMSWTPTDSAFRDEVREFLAASLTDDLRAAGLRRTSVYADHRASMHWQSILNARGWAAPAWPKRYGGAGWSVTQRYIWALELAYAGAPPLSPMGIQMCGPVLIGHGSDEQKERFLPRMLSGEDFWCQGYSEPEAGSDLASLQMRAEDDGDDFICTGQKIWTTHAQFANWIFCLVRTDRSVSRPQLGITFLLIDMQSAGVSVHPIVSPSGEHIQNSVFFDNVRVPKRNVVGNIGSGWTVAKYLLEFERGGSAYAPELQVRVDRLAAAALQAPADRGGSLLDDPLFAARLAAARIRVETLAAYEFRAMSEAEAGGSPGVSGSIMKIVGTELSQHLTELDLEVAGHHGRAYQPQATIPGGAVLLPHGDTWVGLRDSAIAPLHFLNDRAGSIYAGSNEIQRNIIAKAALGL